MDNSGWTNGSHSLEKRLRLVREEKSMDDHSSMEDQFNIFNALRFQEFVHVSTAHSYVRSEPPHPRSAPRLSPFVVAHYASTASPSCPSPEILYALPAPRVHAPLPRVRSSLFFIPGPPKADQEPINKEMRGDAENRETRRRVRRTIKPLPHTRTTERNRWREKRKKSDKRLHGLYQ